MVLVGCYAGLRIGEQAALRIEDVSFTKRRIHVRQGLTEVGGRTAIGRPKTKHSRGRVEIPKFLVEELDRHIHANGNEIGFVFASPEGKLLRPSLWRRRFWHPAVTASIGQPAQPHDMRHTFVSILIAQGLSVEKVCEQARHSDPAFTWRVYKHDFDKRSEAMAEALAGLDLLRSSAASNTIAHPR